MSSAKWWSLCFGFKRHETCYYIGLVPLSSGETRDTLGVVILLCISPLCAISHLSWSILMQPQEMQSFSWSCWWLYPVLYKHQIYVRLVMWLTSLQWRHNGRDGVSNHQRLDCLLNRFYRRRSKKTSKLRDFERGIHRGPVNSPHKWSVMRKMFPFDDVILLSFGLGSYVVSCHEVIKFITSWQLTTFDPRPKDNMMTSSFKISHITRWSQDSAYSV